jgi:hypothetical protein
MSSAMFHFGIAVDMDSGTKHYSARHLRFDLIIVLIIVASLLARLLSSESGLALAVANERRHQTAALKTS